MMLISYSRHSLLISSVGKRTVLVPRLQDLGNNLPVEFRMSLYSNETARSTHALYFAAGRRTKRDRAGRIVVDDITVHLVEALKNVVSHATSRAMKEGREARS